VKSLARLPEESSAGGPVEGRGRPRPYRGRRGSAFSLIELITVMAVLAIVALAAGVPTLSYISAVRTRSAAARLCNDIRYAQRTALSSGLRTWVAFDLEAGNYRLFIENAANPGKANRSPLALPAEQSGQPVQFGSGLFAGVTLTGVNVAGGGEIEFDTFGVPYDATGARLVAPATVTLSGNLVVTVHQVTGYVEQTG